MFLERIERLCVERGITLTKMAEEARLGLGTVTGWRNGASPRPGSLKKVADYLGVSIDYILNGNESANYASNIHNSNVVQGNHAQTLIVRNGEKAERPLSRQEIELLRVFSALSVKDQTRLLGFAFELETAPSK